MKVAVTLGDRQLVVDVPETPGAPLAVDGTSVPTEVVQVRPGLYSLLIAGRSYEVALDAPGAPRSATEEVTAHTGGVPLDLRLEDERRRALAAGQAAHAGATDRVSTVTLTAPMPGRVIAVLATAGASVERGQPLIVLEAMKMESALNAPHAGAVLEVLVSPGDTVQQRQPLLRLGER